MAGAVWGIDLGKAALKAVKLRATRDDLEIKAVEHIDYEGGAGDDDKRAEQVRDALKVFLAKHKIGNDSVLVALPGLHAFSRFIKLPPVDKKKIGMMVRLEAQQQIPFPIADVNWDFQQIERAYAPGEEIEVGIFATQKDRITGFLGDLSSQSLEPGVVTIAPLSIYNFVTYNYDLGDEAVVVLDIGSDHTDLVVVDGPRFWLRNLRIAGNDITKALAERFKVSFEEAEKLKRNASKSDQSKKIFSSMEPTLKDLVGEVQRSVGFFKSQAAGGELKITKMILLGDGSKLKNLPPFFEKELGYPVEKVQKLEQDKFVLDPEVDLEVFKKHILGFGVALGLAIQGVNKARCSINLAPEHVKVQEQLSRKVPFAAAAAACAWAALGLSYMNWSSWRDRLEDTLKQTSVLDNFDKIQTEAKASDERGKALAKMSEPLKGLVVNRILPLDVLRKLRDILPANNGKIPQLDPVDQGKALDTQRDKINEQRQVLQTDNKLWVLDLAMEKKPGGPNADPTKPPLPEGIYKVTIKLAKALPATTNQQDVRNAMKNDFVKPLCEALKAEPFFVKIPDKTEVDSWYQNTTNPEAFMGQILSSGGEIGQLDPNSASATTVMYEQGFRAFAADVTFEVGLTAPPAPAAAPAKEGN